MHMTALPWFAVPLQLVQYVEEARMAGVVSLF